jgi:hypothetical protein
MPRSRSQKIARLFALALVLAFGLVQGPGVAAADDGGTTTTPSNGSAAPAAAAAFAVTPIGGGFTEVPGIQYFVVPGNGSSTAHFDYVGREAICANVLDVFRVDGTDGDIGGVLPGDPAWLTAASGQSPQVVFSASARPGASIDLTFQGGDVLAFAFTGCQGTGSPPYFSFDAANPNGYDHVKTYQDSSTGQWQMGWEDEPGLGGDFNDMVVNVTGLQGGGSVSPPADTTPPPVPTITDSPPDPFNSDSASFSFADDEAGVVFLCQIGTGAFTDCASPQVYSGLTEGVNTFSVEAEDAAGNVSAPAVYSWTIDLGPCTQSDPRCSLVPEGSSSTVTPDPSPCGTVTAADSTADGTSSATPDSVCGGAAKKLYCAWFYDDEPMDGTTSIITFVIHQITPHIQFHYCIVRNKAVTKVDGVSASNVYKKYPWVYKGLFQDPAVGGIGTKVAKVTFSMSYQQCAFKDLGCFDSRDVTLEATINAKAKKGTNPVTVKVTAD